MAGEGGFAYDLFESRFALFLKPLTEAKRCRG